jgi:hypothetical protein
MATTTERDGTRPNPPLWGSLAYLLMNLPIGIAGFVFVVTTMSVGVSTVIIWVGLAVLALAVLAWRGAARLERLRVHAMLGTYVADPYRPLPEGAGRWIARFKDPATWKDMAYFVLLLPIGIAEFTISVTTWSVGLYLSLLPLYWTAVPDDWHLVMWNNRVFEPESWIGTLPLSAVGVLVLALSIVITKGLGTMHARYARAMLGPSPRRVSQMEKLNTAGAIDWTSPMNFGPVTR